MQVVWLCLSILTASLLQASYASARAYEHPAQTALLSLLLSAAGLYIVHTCYPQLFSDARRDNSSYELVTCRDQIENEVGKDDDAYANESTKSYRQIATTVLATLLLAIRIEVFRRIRANEECTSQDFTTFVPLILSIYDARSRKELKIVTEEQPENSIYDDLQSGAWSFLLKHRWRYVPSVVAMVWGCYGLMGIERGQTSTVICSISSGNAAWLPRLQVGAMLLDSLLAITADCLMSWDRSSSIAAPKIQPYINVLLGSAGVWTAIAASLLVINVDKGTWMVFLNDHQPAFVLASMIGQAMLFCGFIVSTAYLILTNGILLVSVILTVSTTILPTLYLVWSSGQPIPVISGWSTVLACATIYFGLWLYHSINRSIRGPNRAGSRFGMAIPFMVLCIAIWPELTRTSKVYFHPIDLLMYDARNQHDQYLRFANHSSDLEMAVTLYKDRYRINPPPGFDVWWKFVQERDATITDDFDQIMVDLLPFRAIPPQQLRLQTLELVSDPWNDISGIDIRQGKATRQGSATVVHDVMLDGIVSMINNFAKDLPDMTLAFNLEDLPRVAVPHKVFGELRRVAREIKLDGVNDWLADRATDWSTSEPPALTDTVFQDWSLRNIFDQFGTINCPTNMIVPRYHLNPFQPHACVSCTAPHSIGQFVSNWSLAANPCHQPDLAQLYGAYMAPSVFKPTSELRPVFSSSKMHGFADILYPSALNYVDSIAYKPTKVSDDNQQANPIQSYQDLPFSSKVNSLYWRGSTSEGVSYGNGLWRGMARQRLVHMVNNLTTSFHDQLTVLLPENHGKRRYAYQVLSAKELLGLGLQTDIHLDDHVASCAGIDCASQLEELGVVTPDDFQQHWKYRFLIDLDGPGSTGHFLPFLQSHSVPFKAGMSREWFDSRLTPWRHFVPQDLRFHGLWSTLAYFAGVDGYLGQGGRRVTWEPHLKEAELIAEEGRDWANKVLRKEDMEIYMFRLLLEWARLTDDKRDELGFALP